MLEDLERALLNAGAIILNVSQNKYIRAADPISADTISQAVEKLALGRNLSEQEEWIVSAPGKIILFGEHAVVHGVVSAAKFITQLLSGNLVADNSPYYSDSYCCFSGPAMLWPCNS